jgi:hypothetical protein
LSTTVPVSWLVVAPKVDEATSITAITVRLDKKELDLFIHSSFRSVASIFH